MSLYSGHKDRENRAFALVMVLIVITVLATLAIEMNFSSSVSAKVTANMRDSAKALYLAKSGVEMSKQRIRMDTMGHQQFGNFIGKADYSSEFWWAVPLLYPMGAEFFKTQLEEAGMDGDELEKFSKSQDIGGSFTAVITDESSRINLSDIQLAGKTPNGSYVALSNLLSLPAFEKFFRSRSREEVLNNIVDWVDPDSQLAGMSGGFEDAKYDYKVKNLPFFVPNEVKLVNGVSYDLYGAMEPFITVFPYTTPQSPTPLGRINLNTAPAEVIASLFDRGVVSDPLGIAKEIIKMREEEGLTFQETKEFYSFLNDKFSLDQESESKPIPRPIEQIIDIRTDFFRVVSTGNSGDATQTITAVIDRRTSQLTTLYWRTD